MSIRISESNLENVQTIEAVVAGPDGANRLLTVTGFAKGVLEAFADTPNDLVGATETFTVLVGPQLTRRQFHRAIASVSLANFFQEGRPAFAQWSVVGSDADWDDEEERVELRAEFQVVVLVNAANRQSTTSITKFGFQVTILAEL